MITGRLTRKPFTWLAAAALVLLAVTVSCTIKPSSHATSPPAVPTSARSSSAFPTSGTRICGQPILNSPYSYNGYKGTAAIAFTSGQFGLPSFGSPGTKYPKVTAGYIVPSGDNKTVDWDTLNAARVMIYFEPGSHTNLPQIQPGDDSVFIGAYSAGRGEAKIDNGGNPNTTFISYASNVTIEYLTIANFNGTESANSFGGAIVDEYGGNGWTVDHNTIGPNGSTLGKPYTGYGIGVGSDSSYEYNCIIQNGEGGFNNGTDTANLPDPAPWGGPANYTIQHNEISGNAIATDTNTTTWGDMCGCAGGIKVFWSLNGTIDHNYIHDNYGVGVWPDTNNSGLDISYNYISNNFDSAIAYEASFNANITHNNITGNGWNPEGTSEWAGWPNGYQTSNGGGPGFADGAIYISNSGGSSNVRSGSSRYRGKLNIIDNNLVNNFGGVAVFQDRNRFCGEGPDGGQDTCTINGSYSARKPVGSPYYVQPTSYAEDATVSKGSKSLTTTSGFQTNYIDGSSKPAAGWTVGAYYNPGDATPGIFPAGDKIASCSSNTSCTLTAPATANVTGGSQGGKRIEIEAGPPGGCGMYDLMDSNAGAITGSPAAAYFDNCNWWVRNVTVSGNNFSVNANPTTTWVSGKVTNCTAATGCGYMVLYASEGACTNGCFWSPYAGSITSHFVISSAAHNVWGNNAYRWTGPGGWSFDTGNQGNQVSLAEWRAAPYGQDAGSTFNVAPLSTTSTPTLIPTSSVFSSGKVGDLKPPPEATLSSVKLATFTYPTDLRHFREPRG